MKQRLSLFLVTALVAALFVPLVQAATAAWPASSTGVEIGSAIRALYPALEPSGLTWHSGRNQLMGVGDEGQVFAINADGSNPTLWNTPGDLEDIVVVDPASPYVYLADENGWIVKYNLSTSSVAQTWSVTTWMPEVDCDGDPSTVSTCGMEALTYVNGYFYAGYQLNGKIFKLDLSGNTAVKVGEFTPIAASISGLHYRDGYLYALYNSTLAVLDLQGNVKVSYSVPGISQEGLALGTDSNGDGDANMFIAQDGTSYKIYSYDNFPIYGAAPAPAPTPTPTPAPVVTDPDNDGDGFKASVDCNDSNATVNAYKTFYVDADKDGLGSKTTASLCAVTAPSGYATNSNDTNDTIPNAGVEIKKDRVDNNSNGKVDETNIGFVHPYYSTLDPNASSSGKILGVSGLAYGDFYILYGDQSAFRFSAFNTRTTQKSTVSLVGATGILQVTSGGNTVKVNAYTGQIVP